MIIKDIHIDGFGLFNEKSLRGLDKGVHVILGNNEAGKSTLLKFIRHTLFGYPRKIDERMPPLRGGSHGGRIIARTSSAEEVIFDRKGNDQIQLTHQGDQTENVSKWNLLLGHANKELFNNVYSFTLDELTDLASLDASGMQDKIYSVGLGLGRTSVGDIIGTIEESADGLYKKRGKIHKVAKILGEIEGVNAKIAAIRNSLPEYTRLVQEITEQENTITEQRNLIDEWSNERYSLDSYLKCYDSFLIILNANAELESLPEYENLPEDGKEDLLNLEREIAGYEDRIFQLQNGTVDEPGIKELQVALDDISFNADLLRPAEKVEYLKTNLELYKVNIEENKNDSSRIDEIEQTIQQDISNIDGRWGEESISDFKDGTVHQDAILGFRKRLESISERKGALDAKKDVLLSTRSPLNVKAVALLFSILFLCGSALLFINVHYPAGAASLFLAIVTFFSRKYLVRGGSENSLEKEISSVNNEAKDIQQSYEEYLSKDLNLNPSLSTETTLRVFDSIDSLKKIISERDGIRRKMEEERGPSILNFEEQVKTLTEIAGNIEELDNMEIQVNRVVDEYNTCKTAHDEKIKLQEDIERKANEAARNESNKNKVENKITDLFSKVNETDRDAYLRKFELNDRVKSLVDGRKAAVQTIETVAGHHKSAEVIKYLEQNDKTSIELNVVELDARIKESKDLLSTDEQRIGKKKNELSRIEGESELAESLTELETHKQILQNTHKEWMVQKTALALLDQVRAEYEQEKQPELIKSSSAFFKKITSGRYKKIRVSMDENDLTVFDEREVQKKIGELSRGTREQLLTSLRLGLIMEYEKRSEPLPIIVDEILVNYDPERAKKTASILQEFGEDRQILFFTCHPSTLNYFDKSVIKLDLTDNF